MSRDNLIVGDLVLEIGAANICKAGESICGDFWCQIPSEDQQILVLSDGMGSGKSAALDSKMTVI